MHAYNLMSNLTPTPHPFPSPSLQVKTLWFTYTDLSLTLEKDEANVLHSSCNSQRELVCVAWADITLATYTI